MHFTTSFIPATLLLPSGAETAELPLQVLIEFASAKLLAEVAERLRQPPVVRELPAGILIGPSVLAWARERFHEAKWAWWWRRLIWDCTTLAPPLLISYRDLNSPRAASDDA